MGGTKPWPEVPVGNFDHSSAAVLIIGAGISGMCTAIELKKAGIQNFIILEKSSSVGGTWSDNKYPGCCCDVWSLLYSYSFDQNPSWTREYPGQEEILAYLISIAQKYNLYRHIRFNTSVDSSNWDETNKEWRTEVSIAQGSKDSEYQESKGYTITSDFLVSAVGQLNQPQFPDIEGLDDFKGKRMHSARWDWSYNIEGKRIAMIGNGATAAQIAPELAKVASHLTIYQRTPNWVIPREDQAVTPLRRTLQKYFPPIMHRIRAGMMDFREAFFEAVTDPNSEMAGQLKDMCLNQIHAALPDQPTMWEKLTPNYAVGCKRVIISDDYYPTLARSNVTLETRPISHITSSGVAVRPTDAEPEHLENEIDVLVTATGFKTLQFMHPINFVGAHNTPLNTIWADGATAYNGITVPNLPNFGMLYGPNTNLGHNSIILMIEAQAKYITALASAVLEARLRDPKGGNMGGNQAAMRRGADVEGVEHRIALTPKEEKVKEYSEEMQDRLGKSSFNDPNCNSWYKDPKTGRITNNWAGTVVEYQKRVAEVAWGDYEGGEEVVRMRGGEEKTYLGRVREESYLSDKALAGVVGGLAVVAGVAGWVMRAQGRVGGRLRA